MALQSSGQISLSQIAAEFGGSAPHSMSEYYAGGSNVASGTGSIPTSGQIKLAADFYGTANEVIVGQVTVNNIVRRSLKTGLHHDGYSNNDSQNANGGNSQGSITSASGIASGIACVYFRDDDVLQNDQTRWRFSGGATPSNFSKVRFTNNNGGTYTITSIPTPLSTDLYQYDHGSQSFTNYWVGRSSMLVEFIQ